MDIEMIIKTALDSIDSLRTPDCLGIDVIGQYAGGTLSVEQKRITEEHLCTCLYCLRELTDLTEMLYCLEHPTPAPDELIARLQAVILGR